MRLPTGEVTFLFTDLEASTRLLQMLGDEYEALLRQHRRVTSRVWREHGGTQFGRAGDACFVAFPAAPAALSAAAALQAAVAEATWPRSTRPRLRVAVHLGRPRIRNGDYWGVDVHYAARLCTAANGGQVLVSAAAAAAAPQNALRFLGDHRLKDFPEPQGIYQLDCAGTPGYPPPRSIDPVPTNLPAPVDAFFGREAALGAIEAALTGTRRLITVTGPGGIGKSRLALVAARRLTGSFPGGVFLVRLDEVRQPEDVPAAIAEAVGLPELPGIDPLRRLREHIRGRRMLLVLDNMEHVVAAGGAVHELMRSEAELRLIVTSQAALRVAGEELLPLTALDVPGEGLTPAELERVPAVALLLDRARSATGAFDLTPENAPAIAALTRQLEGLPLALELAAVRLREVDAADLAVRARESVDALGTGPRTLPPRQRGLRAALEWTIGLLPAVDRLALARLSVFSGGFSTRFATAAWADMEDRITTLVEVSLVRPDAGGRLSLPPPVQQLAGDLLASSDGQAEARQAHAAGLASLLPEWDMHWTVQPPEAARLLDEELANLRAALAWAAASAPALRNRLVATAAWWLVLSGRVSEATEHLAAALESATDPRLRARLLDAHALTAVGTGNARAAISAVEAWRVLGDPGGLAMALASLSNVHAFAGRADAALETAREAVGAAALKEDPDTAALADVSLGQALHLAGRYGEAVALLGALAERAPTGFLGFAAVTCLADAELLGGAVREAARHYAEALVRARAMALHALEIFQLDGMALALFRMGRNFEAGVASAAAQIARDSMSLPLPRFFEGLHEDMTRQFGDAAGGHARARAAEMGPRDTLDWVTAVAASVA